MRSLRSLTIVEEYDVDRVNSLASLAGLVTAFQVSKAGSRISSMGVRRTLGVRNNFAIKLNSFDNTN